MTVHRKKKACRSWLEHCSVGNNGLRHQNTAENTASDHRNQAVRKRKILEVIDMARVFLRVPRIPSLRAQIAAQRATCLSAHQTNLAIRDLSSTGGVRPQDWQLSSRRRPLLQKEICCRRSIASSRETVASVTQTSCRSITTPSPQQMMHHVHGTR